MDQAKVRRKIDALLEVVRHPKTDPTLAQTYLAKVAELRTRYHLADDQAQGRTTRTPGTDDTGVRWWETHIPDTGGRGAACAAALAYVIDACGGMSVRGKAKSAGGYRFTVVATEAAMELIQQLVPVVLEQMHQRSVAECRRWRAEHLGGASDSQAKTWREDYVRAFGFGLAERIRAGNRRITDEGETGRAAGVVLAADRKKVQRAYARKFGPRVRTVRGQGVRHQQAAEAGRRHGRAADPQAGHEA
ncbi:hypothetical protein NE857_34095 (plasmid) [Nocardiopsis exhalans]|uniref:DUF2786 domain-containing protein n=1 Tax=Nocardiopsis exhalans TaxID=163604 RepID=A0ABY5DGU6_9ACTN|nr:hypothetical protein [Nocardiopsis exhalans]USY23566.1 hypothetical protein NE857_34095 [Nocardiopsis exhalans]